MDIGKLPHKSDCHYRGTVESHGNHTVSAALCNEWRASIVQDDHFLVLSPIPKRLLPHRQRSKRDATGEVQYRRHILYKRWIQVLQLFLFFYLSSTFRQSALAPKREEPAIAITMENENSVENDEFCITGSFVSALSFN